MWTYKASKAAGSHDHDNTQPELAGIAFLRHTLRLQEVCHLSLQLVPVLCAVLVFRPGAAPGAAALGLGLPRGRQRRPGLAGPAG